MENNLISVIIPAYNCEKYIQTTVNSVLSQTYQNFEIIIVNDCSMDNTQEEIKKLQELDDRISLFNNEQNSGVSFSRNFGVSKAKGEWIAFLDSDDVWEDTKLEKQLELVKEFPEGVLFYTASSFMTDDGEELQGLVLHAKKRVNRRQILKQNIISCSSVLVKKSVIEKYPFGGDQLNEDHACWLGILKEFSFAYGVDEPLLKYRLANNSRSKDKKKVIKRSYRTYRASGLSVVSTAYYFIFYMAKSYLKYKKISKAKKKLEK